MGSDEPPVFIYHLPYEIRKPLCRVLDINDSWEELGGVHMKFDVGTLQRFGQAVLRNQSPTDNLLTLWGTQNHTILELFILLSKMQHYQAMKLLKPLVESKYHKLIYEGEENFSNFLSFGKGDILQKHKLNEQEGNFQTSKYLSPEEHNINRKEFNHQSESKAISIKPNNIIDAEVKIVNTLKEVNIECAQAIEKSELPLGEGVAGTPTPKIMYAELESATSGWDKRNLLGKGGFGAVYRGTWKNTHVAIKRLEMQKDGDFEHMWKTQREQSLRELRYLNSFRHDHILPLYGYSIGGPYDCLVYQYMPNGSLEDRLLCRDQTKPLNWIQRLNICTGIAGGLQFLHTVDEKPLVHGDIKSANILLDPHLEPKIGDFGLAREGPLKPYTHVKVSRVHGTRPYLPDDFLKARKLSTKVDTYSFGIVLFELATGLRAYDESRQHKFLKELVESSADKEMSSFQDKKAGCDEIHMFPSLISVGRRCISSKPKDRPEMVYVHEELKIMSSEVEKVTYMKCFVRHNSLTPTLQNEPHQMPDHQRRLSLPPNQIIKGAGAGPCNPISPGPLHLLNPFINFPSNTKCNYSNTPLPSNSKSHPHFSSTPSNSVKTGSPNFSACPKISTNPQIPSSALSFSTGESPTIKVSPPSASNLSDLLPQNFNKGTNEECDLPLISELGIKQDNFSIKTQSSS